MAAACYGESTVGTERKQRLIAIVDDDESVRRAIRGVLESAGFNVSVFHSAESFLPSQQGTFACLVTDYKMPEMDGLELQRRLAEKDARIPTIFVSARGSVAFDRVQ